MFAASRSSGAPQLLFLYAGCFLLLGGVLPFDAPRHVAAAAAPPVSFSFNFSNPSTYNLHDLRFEGTAEVRGKLVDLTCNARENSIQGCKGRMSYAHPVPFYDSATGVMTSFATRFTFRVLPENGTMRGDGMAFFLTGYPSEMPPHSEGAGLGLMDSNKERQAYEAHRFVAVEFDSYINSFEYPDPMKSLDHIAVDLNSVRNSFNMTRLNSSVLLDGNMTASISFDGSTRRLVATLQFHDRPSAKPIEVSAQLPNPIAALLPPEVAVGFSASTGTTVELHQIFSWSFDSTLAPKKQIASTGGGLIIAAVVGGLVVFVVVVWFIMAWFVQKRARDNLVAETGQRRFRYRDLVNATDNFSEKRKLGKGAFGAVYRGTSLKGHEGQVAVKKIFKGSLGGPKNFLDEINTISKTKHKNLVSLEGWCCSRSWNLMCWCCQKQDDPNIFLVYELMPKGNLHDHLHKDDTILPWPTRYKIVKGIGSALLYLHHECDPYILHRDIKPENILLDNDYNAKLADFGLSRIADHNNATVVTKAVGTRGYMDPQCMKQGKVRFNRSTDLYSFGIVLLEIACKCNKSREGVWNLYSNETAERMVEAVADESLGGNFDRAQMHRVLVLGLWCSLPDSAQRPSIQDVMRILEHDDAPLPDLASSAADSST